MNPEASMLLMSLLCKTWDDLTRLKDAVHPDYQKVLQMTRQDQENVAAIVRDLRHQDRFAELRAAVDNARWAEVR